MKPRLSTGRLLATANWLKSSGARRFGGSSSGVAWLIATSEVTGALLMLRLVSVNVPLTAVISNPLVGYFPSVAGPKVITSDPLTPASLLNVRGIVAACA
jgi:hypothetical protein